MKGGKKSKKSQSSNSNSSSAPSGKNSQEKLLKLVHVGPSAQAYARALANPKTGPIAGIPNPPAQLSKKVRVWNKGTLSTNGAGFGGIAVNPGTGILNDQYSVMRTKVGGSTTSFNFPAGPVANADWDVAATNAEYALAQVGPGDNQFVYRIISAVLSLRYIDTELNRGGQVVGLHDPAHTTLYGRALTDLDGEESSRRFAIERKWTSVLYRPVHTHDTDFSNQIPAYVPGGSDESWYMGFAIQAPGATPVTFEYEFYAVYELFGKNIRGMTPSTVDAIGYAAVHTVSALGKHLFPTDTSLQKNEQDFLGSVVKYLMTDSTHVSTVPSSTASKLEHVARITKDGAVIASSAASIASTSWSVAEAVLDFLGL